MESIWQKAKSFAEEAAKRSQTLASSSSKIADLAVEASRKADELRSVADHHLKSLADQIHLPALSSFSDPSSAPSDSEFECFGITNDLIAFVKGFTSATFQSFPVQDDLSSSDIPTLSNIQQDLSEWQRKHATLVLTTVKHISRLRYELCPRHMKDGRFWRIYFTLVSTHVAPYVKKYMDEIKLNKTLQIKDDNVKEVTVVGGTSKSEVTGADLKRRTSTSSVEQDIDTFLLGDLDNSDGDKDDIDETFDDDFDKIEDLVSKNDL